MFGILYRVIIHVKKKKKRFFTDLGNHFEILFFKFGNLCAHEDQLAVIISSIIVIIWLEGVSALMEKFSRIKKAHEKKNRGPTQSQSNKTI